MTKRIVLFLLVLAGTMPALRAQSFLQQQLQNATFRRAFDEKDTLLKREFEAKGLAYPPRYMYVRSFKYDSELEVWVKQHQADTFRLFKTYRICALSGTLGPKHREGDGQVPEGFYYIDRFNPNSLYHLALGLNYPNNADRKTLGEGDLGGGIYIHGSCVTVGCIPLTDSRIEEVYILAVHAHDLGQEYIPVHIFPIRFNNPRSQAFLASVSASDGPSQHFWINLKQAYDAFNRNHRMPVVMFHDRGRYVLQSNHLDRGTAATARHLPAQKAPLPGSQPTASVNSQSSRVPMENLH